MNVELENVEPVASDPTAQFDYAGLNASGRKILHAWHASLDCFTPDTQLTLEGFFPHGAPYQLRQVIAGLRWGGAIGQACKELVGQFLTEAGVEYFVQGAHRNDLLPKRRTLDEVRSEIFNVSEKIKLEPCIWLKDSKSQGCNRVLLWVVVRRLADPCVQTRWQAFQSLLGSPDLETFLALVLGADDELCRVAAENMDFNETTPVRILLDVVNSGLDADARWSIIRAIGWVGPEASEAIPSLVYCIMTEKDQRIVDAAELALEQIMGVAM